MSIEEFETLDPSPEKFRDAGYRAVDMMAEHYAQIDEVSVLPDATPAEVERLFDEPLPESGTDLQSVMDAWEERVYPYAAHEGSPRWYGYVMGSGTPVGALASALAASVNMNAGGWVGGPSATEIERQCIRWLAEMIGYPTDCGGVLTSGGTMANHSALFAALQEANDFETQAEGLVGLDDTKGFTLYESAHEGHSSVNRVAEMIGIGSSAIRSVPDDEHYRMDPDALVSMIESDIEAGYTPFAVVAQVGSINVSAIDPLDAIADICEEYDIWMHADGACGAVGAILPDKAHLYEGLDRADSVTLDPHKWLSIPYGCGCVLFRDPEVQARAFSMHASYLDVSEREEYQGTNFGFLGPEMSRPFRGLKLWMSIKARGIEGYRKLLSQGCRCAEHLHERVSEADDFEVLQEPNLFIYSFRYLPPDLTDGLDDPARREEIDTYVDWLNQQIADDLRFTGLAYITTTIVEGRTVIRFSICSHRTTPKDIDMTFEAVREHGERIDESARSDFEAV